MILPSAAAAAVVRSRGFGVPFPGCVTSEKSAEPVFTEGFPVDFAVEVAVEVAAEVAVEVAAEVAVEVAAVAVLAVAPVAELAVESVGVAGFVARFVAAVPVAMVVVAVDPDSDAETAGDEAPTTFAGGGELRAQAERTAAAARPSAE